MDQTPISFQLQLKKIIEESDGEETAEEGLIQLHTVSFPSLPESGLCLKKGIERALKVPVCVQRLYFGPTIIKNDQPISKLRLRDQDSLTLEYPSHAEISTIDDILQIMGDSSALLTRVLEYYDSLEDITRLDATLDVLVQQIIDPKTVEKLVFMFARSGTSTISEAQLAKTNRLYFIHSGGVSLVVLLHCQLLEVPWRKMSIEMQYMEHSLLRILWDLSSTLGARYLLLNYPVIFQASNSLMRGHIVPHQRVECPIGQYAAEQASATTQHYIIGEMMYKAMGVLANLTELPECRASVLEYPGVLNQMISAILSPTYTFVCAQLVLSALLCLSYSTELHSQLALPYVLEGVLKTCTRFEKKLEEVQRENRADPNSIDPKDVTLIKYFSMMFFALLITGSPSLLADTNPDILPRVNEFITNFINSTTCEEVHDAEIRTNYFWSTLKPIVKITYFHFKAHANQAIVKNYPILRSLYVNSMIAGVFSLGNMILKDNFRTILDQEGLTDFVVCLPWVLPQEVMDEFGDFAYSLQSVTKTAPKLVNLIKAKLAASLLSLDVTLRAEFVVSLMSLI